jgi:putative membrane protein
MKRFYALTAIALIASAPAFAQMGAQNNGGMTGNNPSNTRPMRSDSATSDRMNTGSTSNASQAGMDNFLQKVSASNQFEIQSSQMALQKSQDSDIKSFAQDMIDDNTKAGDQLKQTLQQAGANQTPPEGMTLDSKHQEMLNKLKSASGKEFDRMYVQQQRQAHKEAVSLFQTYAKNGKDEKLKNFAQETLPTLKEHEQHVQKLGKKS